MAEYSTPQPLAELHPDLRGSGRRDARHVVLEIVFHPDVRRIGDLCVVGPADVVHEITVGRDLDFSARINGAFGEPQPLGDPCVSRRQFLLRWSGMPKQFYAADVHARGSVRVLDPRGREAGSIDRPIPPNWLLTLDDRVVLRCSTRAIEAGVDLGLVGQSTVMADLRGKIRAMARLKDTVLVRGEAGSGKELVARALHHASERESGPFIAVNCAALPENLIEAELFGYASGAFTGAGKGEAGLFAAARGGTIFLDEIGDMPMAAQTRLLRVLQEGSVRPVGSRVEVDVDARVVAATNRDLEADVSAGRFRNDLLTRLAGLEIEVLPLRARLPDIPLLFTTFFLRRAAAKGSALHRFVRDADRYAPCVPVESVLSLLAYEWPGNVRELERYVAAVEVESGDEGALVAPALGVRVVAAPATIAVPETVAVAADEDEAAPAGRRPGDPAIVHHMVPSIAARPPGARGSTGSEARSTGAQASVFAQARAQALSRPDAAELERLFEENDFVAARVAEALGTARPTVVRWAQEVGLTLPQDLSRQAIAAVLDSAGGDLVKAARGLRVGLRGLKARMRELGFDLPRSIS